MAVVPTAKIYNSANDTLVYNLGNMIAIEGWPNDEEPSSVSYKNLRSAGEISVNGGNKSFDITITARLTAADYDALISAWETLQSTIAINTAYYLRLDKTVSTYDSIKVKRLQKIIPVNTNNWNSWVYFQITLRALSW